MKVSVSLVTKTLKPPPSDWALTPSAMEPLSLSAEVSYCFGGDEPGAPLPLPPEHVPLSPSSRSRGRGLAG